MSAKTTSKWKKVAFRVSKSSWREKARGHGLPSRTELMELVKKTRMIAPQVVALTATVGTTEARSSKEAAVEMIRTTTATTTATTTTTKTPIESLASTSSLAATVIRGGIPVLGPARIQGSRHRM
ncbi:unnamed protein product [Globisporangium polare]